MEKSVLDFDISKEFEIDFDVDFDAEKQKLEDYKRILRNTNEIRKQLITIDGKIVDG